MLSSFHVREIPAKPCPRRRPLLCACAPPKRPADRDPSVARRLRRAPAIEPSAFAKNLEKTPTPVSVEAKPALVIAGGTVTIKGSSVPLGKHSQVTLTIQPPPARP